MDRSKDLREMGAALIAGTGYTDGQVPNMKGVTFFGTHGDVGLWTDFLGALIAIAGEDAARDARITKIVRRVDALAEEKAELVLGRLKNEIKDIADGEAMFVVSYLYVAYGIAAMPSETAPAEPVATAPAAAPVPSGPRRVVASAAPATGTAQAPPAAAAPPPPPVRVVGPLVDLDAIGDAPAPAPAQPDEPAPAPAATTPTSVFRSRAATDHEMAALSGKGHGHTEAKKKQPESPAHVWHKVGAVLVLLAGLAVICSGLLWFLTWLF